MNVVKLSLAGAVQHQLDRVTEMIVPGLKYYNYTERFNIVVHLKTQ